MQAARPVSTRAAALQLRLHVLGAVGMGHASDGVSHVSRRRKYFPIGQKPEGKSVGRQYDNFRPNHKGYPGLVADYTREDEGVKREARRSPSMGEHSPPD